ncbi:MAG: PASTA domain-containing protein, partial [bacterium]
MKKLLVALCVGFLCPYLWAEIREKKGEITISYIEGEVETLLSGKKDWEKAKLYQKLTMGDRIRTKFSSKAELKLSDGSTINMSENSIMDITELLEKGLTRKSGFKLWMGGIKARFERLKTKDSEAKFYTPTAVMGLRGTTLWLLVDWEGKTRCGFEEGRGYIYSDKEGEKPVNENEEASVSLEGDITIKTLEMKTVPNVMGKMLDEAKNDIIAAGLKVGEIRAEESDKPKDEVLSQYPVGGSEVLANTSVNLVIALEIPPCIVPDLIGMQRADAEKAIIEAGLTLGMVIEQTSTKPKDEVLRQRPNPGTEVKKESPVDLLISSGPPPKVIVPDLIGKTIDEAKAILEGVGLKLSGIILKKESA